MDKDRARFDRMWTRLEQRLQEAGIAKAAASLHVTDGRNSGYIGDLRRTKNGKDFRFPDSELGRRLAELLQVDHSWLLGRTDEPTPAPFDRSRAPARVFGRTLNEAKLLAAVAKRIAATAHDAAARLPLLGYVRAGAWLDVDALEAPRESLLPLLPGVPSTAQYAVGVIGDSLDELVPDGAQLHVIDAAATGYRPAHGDIVIVERRRGQLVERTAKEVRFTADGALSLVARSRNPRWSDTIELGDADDGDVRIIGRVRRYAGEL